VKGKERKKKERKQEKRCEKAQIHGFKGLLGGIGVAELTLNPS
jgi:hypothetical protein